MTVTLTDRPINPIEFFRVRSESAASETNRINLLRAVDSLSKFIGGTEINFDSFDETMIGEWISRMIFQGYTPKTIYNNILKKIATLYNKAVEEGLAKPTDVFRKFHATLNNVAPENINATVDRKTFNKIQKIIHTDYPTNTKKQLAKDLLLFAVYMGGMGFDEIINFKKDSCNGKNDSLIEIAARYSKPRNRYLFPLKQSQLTPRKMYRILELMFFEALDGTGLKLSPEPSNTSFDLWTCVAMSCGISPSEIAGCLPPQNRKNLITAFVEPAALTESRISEIRNQVVATLTNNPVRWYAMHLRRHVDYDTLTSRLREKNIVLEKIYYPMEEIFHKIGRKKVFETRPVISWLLFFRERVTKLNALYDEIGDLAWGYRYTNDLKSQYAVITDNEIESYQNALGTLTSDTEIIPDEAVKFNEGDCLVILGGAMNGRHAIFISEKTQTKNGNHKKIVFRVKLGGDKNANWIVDWDPRLVRKISQSQYMEIDRKFRQQLD